MNASPFIRIAELHIDPAQLDLFAKAARKIGQAATQAEPGCLALFTAADADAPEHVTVFEIYTDEAAYQTHLATDHFREFRETTQDMIRSRKLRTALPLSLAMNNAAEARGFG